MPKSPDFHHPAPSLWQLIPLLVALLLTSCATPPAATVDPESALAMPMAMNEFMIDPAHDDVIGELQIIRARHEDTLSDIARRFNVGYEEIVAANPGVDPWLPKAGTEIVVPTQWVLPPAPRNGIVINLAAMRLFYFPKAVKGEPQRVVTHPVGIGRVEWKTPQGSTHVVSKAEAPTWIPTASIRREHAENGDPLPASVPPGPDNPMGSHVLRLGWPQYAIHGTNKPASIGLRGTHGCLRMYPEDIEQIYSQVPVGTPVSVINEPQLAGFRDDTLYLQAYPVLEDDKRNHARRVDHVIRAARSHKKATAGGRRHVRVNTTLVEELVQSPRALALPVSTQETAPPVPTLQQVIDQAPRVRNRVPLNARRDGDGDITTAELSPSLNELPLQPPESR